MINSKNKGSKFERDCAKLVSLWVSFGDRDDIYWRTASSGGMATMRAKYGKRADLQVGDLRPETPEASIITDKLILECKCLKTFDLEKYLFNTKRKNTGMQKVISECEIRYRNYKEDFLLICKANNSKVFVCFSMNSILGKKLSFKRIFAPNYRKALVMANGYFIMNWEIFTLNFPKPLDLFKG